jgi:hypothetical protein
MLKWDSWFMAGMMIMTSAKELATSNNFDSYFTINLYSSHVICKTHHTRAVGLYALFGKTAKVAKHVLSHLRWD